MLMNPNQPDPRFLKQLRIMSLTEGVSTILLFFVAMPLKYLYDTPQAVSVVGAIHGLLFCILILMLQLARDRVPISSRLAIGCSVAAVFPFGPFVADRWLRDAGS